MLQINELNNVVTTSRRAGVRRPLLILYNESKGANSWSALYTIINYFSSYSYTPYEV